jgi:Holliday junction resolvase RusA-like endonuclease
MIYLVIPGLPPTSNNAYGHRGRHQFLKAEGRKYKNETTAYLAQTYRNELKIFKKQVGFMLCFRFHSSTLFNQNYKPGGKTNRYKKFDGANLLKLLEDCLATVGGIDDSQTLTSIWQKKEAPDEASEKTEIWAWNLEEESDPFDHDYILSILSGKQ